MPAIAKQCARECILAEDASPLAAAKFIPDSAGAVVLLGEVVVRGETGTTVSVEMLADAKVLEALTEQTLRVEVEGSPRQELPLTALVRGQRVYRFK